MKNLILCVLLVGCGTDVAGLAAADPDSGVVQMRPRYGQTADTAFASGGTAPDAAAGAAGGTIASGGETMGGAGGTIAAGGETMGGAGGMGGAGMGGMGGAPACVPVVETCNGRDDDCDGMIDSRESCANDLAFFARFQNHAYGVNYFRGSWDDTRRECQRLGYDLAVMDSPEEAEWLRGRLLLPFGDPTTDAWIGLRRADATAPWLWFGTTALAVTDWRVGQPNNVNGNEFCVSAAANGWGDRPCDVSPSFTICEASP